MAIPDYQTIMLPMLKLISDQKVHRFRDIVEELATEFNLTREDRLQLLPSGRKAVFYDRVAWAKTYLLKACLLKSEKRAAVEITRRGIELLKSKPKTLNSKMLEQNEEFLVFRNLSHKQDSEMPETNDMERTPEEMLEYSYEKLRANLAQDLLEQVKTCSPVFFEYLVVDLLTRMGYGGSRRDAGQAIGGSGDGGVDGIIKEDKLGLDAIYIQAKRWKEPVPAKEIRDFAGSLTGKKARKGIFITTSSFSPRAHEFVNDSDRKIILIDGEMLANLMIEHNVGITVKNTFEIKKIDFDYFQEE